MIAIRYMRATLETGSVYMFIDIVRDIFAIYSYLGFPRKFKLFRTTFRKIFKLHGNQKCVINRLHSRFNFDSNLFCVDSHITYERNMYQHVYTCYTVKNIFGTLNNKLLKFAANLQIFVYIKYDIFFCYCASFLSTSILSVSQNFIFFLIVTLIMRVRYVDGTSWKLQNCLVPTMESLLL